MADEQKTPLSQRFPAMHRLRRRVWKHRVPEIRQMSFAECGIACLAMVLGYHGRTVGTEELRQVLGVGRDGTSAKLLLTVGRRYGLRGRGVSLDLNSLPYLEAGAVLHWKFTHYVVFEKMNNEGVHIIDPALGRRCVSMEQFRQAFTGVALLFEPGDDFRAGQTPRRGATRYVARLLEHRRLITRIIVLSAALQILTLALPMLTGMVVDRVVPRGDYSLLLVLGAGMLTLVAFQILASLTRGHLLLELRTRIDSSMTLGFLEHLVSLPFPFFQVRAAGDLMMRLNINASIREILSAGAISSVLDGSLVIMYLLFLFAANPWFGLLVLTLGGIQVLVFVFSRQRQQELLARNLELDAKNQSYQFEMLSAMQTLKAFGSEHRAVQQYSQLFVDVLNVSLDRGRLSTWVESLTQALRLASPLTLLAFGTWQVLEKQLTLGEMLALSALATGLLIPLSNLVGTASQFQYLGTYLERLNDVLDASPERPLDRPGASAQLRGGIELEKVSFRYSTTAPLVVENVSVRIQPGQLVAVVGRSGAGKSTLANLLLGLYLPTSGRILYDGTDMNELDLTSLREQTGIVLQEPSFFGATLRSNIALGQTDIPLDAIIEAARVAQLHDEIMSMPLQYDTPLADRGMSLSGGQRQRLALARALVRKPALLLLDEATSALDAVTESRVQDALQQISCTRIVIAHRLSTIIGADTILVMDQGRLVEAGTHGELLARGGAYEQLVRAQLERKSA